MEEAEELERAADWRMRKVDADPSDATSREAAALLERLAQDVRRLPDSPCRGSRIGAASTCSSKERSSSSLRPTSTRPRFGA